MKEKVIGINSWKKGVRGRGEGGGGGIERKFVLNRFLHKQIKKIFLAEKHMNR